MEFISFLHNKFGIRIEQLFVIYVSLKCNIFNWRIESGFLGDVRGGGEQALGQWVKRLDFMKKMRFRIPEKNFSV